MQRGMLTSLLTLTKQLADINATHAKEHATVPLIVLKMRQGSTLKTKSYF